MLEFKRSQKQWELCLTLRHEGLLIGEEFSKDGEKRQP